MSVRKGNRQEGKLQVLNAARELKEYSLNALRNDKIFPKSTRWLYAIPISNAVRDACLCIRRANSVYVKIHEEYIYRHMQQVEAHAHLDSLLDLLDDAYQAHYLSGDKVEFWTGLVLKTDDLLKAWMSSDTIKHTS